MKHEKWLSCLIGAILAFGIAIGGVGCLVTAFGLDPVDMTAVTVLCGVCAVVTAVCFSLRRGGPVLAAAAAVLIGYLLREGTLLLHIESLLYKISKIYDMGYGWGTVWWSGEELTQVPVTGALGLLGGIVALGTAETVCRRKSAFFTVVIGFLPLAACFVVTDTVPDTPWLWLMTACIALLLLTQTVRRNDPKAGVRLTAMLLIPVMLGSMLLFWLNPQQEYRYRLQKVQKVVMDWVSDLPFVVTTPDGNLTIVLDGVVDAQVDLTQVGPKTLLRYPVMDVVAEKGGLIYLRGQSLDVYSGIGWGASEVSTGKDMFFPARNLQSGGRLTVSMRIAHSRMYIPYYIDSSYDMTNGAIANEGGLQDYSYQVMVPKSGYKNIYSSGTVDADRPILYQCLLLPDSTRKAAETILDEIFAGAIMPRDVVNTERIVALLQTYVQQSAKYSLNTPQMPEDEKDFAIWFLRESETGYCVHFASALVVLLRAAGIPARYVTGYTFEAVGGSKTVVRAADAHAWVEYLDPNTGWTVLDATPPQWMEDDTDTPTQPATEPEPTQDATQLTTEPEPTQGATQPKPTDPQDSVAATTPVDGDGPGEEKTEDIGWLWTVLKAAAWAAGIVGFLAGQYGLRRMLRRKKLRKGHRNTRALACWRETKRMARLTGQTPPEELEALAEKAKFSQHTLSAAELLEFDLWLEQARNQLKERPWIVRLVMRLIWAVE